MAEPLEDAAQDFAAGYCDFAGVDTENPAEKFDECADQVSDAYSTVSEAATE